MKVQQTVKLKAEKKAPKFNLPKSIITASLCKRKQQFPYQSVHKLKPYQYFQMLTDFMILFSLIALI